MIELPALPRPAVASHAYPRSRMARPVRVCFLIDRLARAGTETQLLALLRAFDRTVVEPHLVLLDGEDEVSRSLEPGHCPVLRLGVRSLLGRRAAGAARTFARYLRRRNIDIVQTYFFDSTYFGVPVARWAGVRRVVRVRNNLGYSRTLRHRVMDRLCRRLVDLTLTNCEAGRAAMAAEGVPAGRIAVLENGVDAERFACAPPRFGGEVRVGAVANLRPVKGLDVLVRAAAGLLRRHPDLRFEVAGEGPQRGDLEKMIADFGLDNRFRLPGNVAEVPGFLASLDIAVLCSRSEGMSNAVLEYMAAGRPIVATRVGANAELLREGKDGILIEPNDPEALTSAIEGLLDDPEAARQMGAAARQRVAGSFSRDAMRRRFEEFYRALASR